MLIFIFGIFFDYMNRRGKYMSIDKQGSGTAPLVSVYCMTYNQEKTVAQAIESVVSQKTDFAFELIVHDDASTDSTADIIKEYARRYPGIVRPVFQTENRYREHNIIYEYMHPISKGRFIALCEGDDYWSDPEKLSIQTRIMLDNPDCTLSFHAVNQLAADGTVSAFRPLKKSGEVPAPLIVKRGGMFCPTVSLMFRRDILDSWPDFRAAADVYDYPLQVLAAASGKVIYTDRIMGVYRFASEGSWTSMHLNEVDFGHIENETVWLTMFDRYTGGRFSQEINFHMAHIWLTEYRKTLEPRIRRRAGGYIRQLPLRERLLFNFTFAFFSVFGKTADRLFGFIKKRLLK